MENTRIVFEVKDNDVYVSGYPPLEGCKGFVVGDGMAMFYKRDNYEMHIANIETGKIREFSTAAGYLLADDSEIDYSAIEKKFEKGIGNAKNKLVRYSGLNRWGSFKDGLCAISWMLYPDGEYFADSDGFGMEPNAEETVYAIIDTDLNIVEPFRPIADVRAYLHEMRMRNSEKMNKEKGKTMKTRIFNLVIIDESGSMYSIKNEAIDGVNETIQTIRAAQEKHEEQEHFVTLVTFNNDVRTVYECVPVNNVKELTDETYCPICSTALYDAMGMSISALRPKVAADDKVLVTIVTDGYENASKEYSGKAIKALVNEMKGKGWVFAYIGANQDVEAVAAQISITNVINFNATQEGTREMTRDLNRSRERFYSRIAESDFDAKEANTDFFKED